MSLFSRMPVLRWLVPLVTAAVLLGGGWALTQITAAASSGLKPRTAAQLLADVQRAHLDGLSGTIVQKSDLGLPSLPDAGGSGSSQLSSLITGTHTLRVWYSGPDRARVALLGTLGESDVILNGTDLWTWSSKTRTATHQTVQLPEHSKSGELPQAVTTPQAAAKAALAAISPTTKVFTSGTANVAGRPAYELVLQPRGHRSLIGQVRIAVDGATHVPTEFQIVSNKGVTAFDVAFQSFDPTRPDPAQFRFNPPPHTKVVQKDSISPETPRGQSMPGQMSGQLPDHLSGQMPGQMPGDMHGGTHGGAAPHVVGHGWGTVVVADLGQQAVGGLEQKSGQAAGQLGQMLQALPVQTGPWGSGHAFQGTIFSAVLTNDGRVAVGAVPLSRLYAALDTTPAS